MNCHVISELVRSNHKLASLLLTKGSQASSTECAVLVAPCYPFPACHHASWHTPEGAALQAFAAKAGMTVAMMHASPAAAASVLFDDEWRHAAETACRKRVVVLDDAIEQFCNETGCSAAHARLQCVAATKTQLDDLRGVYVTRSGTECHMLIDVAAQEQPSEPTFMSMQDDLTTAEQLLYLMTCNHFAPIFRRVSQGQPLALHAHVCGLPVPKCLAFCDKCCTNWCVDSNGSQTTLLTCQWPSCNAVVHQSCHGRDTYTCALHSSMHAPCKTATDMPPMHPALIATGLVAHQGAWCVSLATWPGKQECVGYLHPTSIDAVAQEAQRKLDASAWTSEAALANLDAIQVTLRELGHRMVTEQMPPPSIWPTGMGQHAHASHALLLSPGIALTLYHLQLYQGFGAMCARFMACGATCDTLDSVVRKWFELRLPILSGTCQAHGDAAHMHAQALAALTSPRTKERSLLSSCHASHWIATQVDAAYPRTEADYGSMLRVLGLQPGCVTALAVPRHMLVADLSHHAAPQPLSVYPVRAMLNPSLHVAALTRVVRTDANLTEALPLFYKHEIAPIARVTSNVVHTFQQRCIMSPLYGRVYLAMMDTAYGELDDTGLLPARHASKGSWKADWSPVNALCECTNATYVGLECGSAPYWRRVLPGRRSFLFEVDAASLHELAKLPLPASTHIVPVCATHFSLQSLCAKTVVVTRRSWPCPRTDACVVHDMTPGKPNSMFMKHFAHTKWTHHACQQADAQAAYAFLLSSS